MIGERIRKLRNESGMSQEQLADAVHVSRQAVSKWETGESLPDTERLMILCHVLDVSADYLLFGKETEAVLSVAQQEVQPAQNGMAQRVAGWIMTALGSIGIVVMWFPNIGRKWRSPTPLPERPITVWNCSACMISPVSSKHTVCRRF